MWNRFNIRACSALLPALPVSPGYLASWKIVASSQGTQVGISQQQIELNQISSLSFSMSLGREP